jgi:Xaa-Pro aminopeptidase
MSKERLAALRARMAREGMDAYLAPTADDHESEYVGAHYKARAYLTGFTGSAGLCAVTMEDAALWTDGRYFIQAANQLAGSGVRLMRDGEPGVPALEEFLLDALPQGGCLGFDGRVVGARMALRLQERLAAKDVRLCAGKDLVGEIWTDRPPRSARPAFLLTERQAGKSARDKIADLRRDMEKEGADAALLTGLDDIAWLLNLRGDDIPYNPYLLAFAAVTREEVLLFAQGEAVPLSVQEALGADGVAVRPYEAVYDWAAALAQGCAVWLDGGKVNYALYARIPKGVRIIDKPTTILNYKAVKNAVEIENLRRSHVMDGVAFARFMRHVKENVGREQMDEYTAGEMLEGLRRQQEGFLELSFDTICAYNANAAMMHYSAAPETAARLAPEGFLLVDSGGQYLNGTTDITRTLMLGPVPMLWKRHYTAVLRGMINLSRARFLKGCRGLNLDILARGPIWDMGLDYRCGTGHGVAYLGGVHEPPNGFRWRIVPERNDSCVLEPGMVTTDEPGVYIEGSHGIRIENELLCVAGEENEYGQFLRFETLTLAPIDLDPVLPEEMTAAERAFLNDYHRAVFAALSPHLNAAEREWLQKCTRAI